MIFSTTIVKALCAIISLGSFIIFSQMTNQAELAIFYIFFIAQSTLLVSFSDLGLNALNSSVRLEQCRILVPSFLESYEKYQFDLIAIFFAGLFLWLLIDLSVLFLIPSIAYVFLRIYVMRWITISRKDISPVTSIVYGDFIHTIINACSLIGLYFSKEYFIGAVTIGLSLQVILLSRNDLGINILFHMLRLSKKQYANGNFLILLQSYFSALKNNIVGALLGLSAEINIDTIFVANRTGQMYAIATGGINNVIPYRLRHRGSIIAVDIFSILLFFAPIILVGMCLLVPDIISSLITLLFNVEVTNLNRALLVVLLIPYLITPLNLILIANSRYTACIMMDFFIVLSILFSVGI